MRFSISVSVARPYFSLDALTASTTAESEAMSVASTTLARMRS